MAKILNPTKEKKKTKIEEPVMEEPSEEEVVQQAMEETVEEFAPVVTPNTPAPTPVVAPAPVQAAAPVMVQAQPMTVTQEQIPSQIFQAKVQAPESSDKVGQVIEQIYGQAVVHTVTTDEKVQEGILNAAKETIKDKTEAIQNKAKKEAQVTHYDVNKDACENYGIMKDVPKWKVKMMRVGSAFWFIIYFIVATVTVVPLSVFVKGLQGAVRQLWLAILLAIVIYLCIVVGIPLVSWGLSKIGG